MWKSTASDVYVATRSFGGISKVSIHESGKCHIRGPDLKHWHSTGAPPKFLDAWSIDPQASFTFPFSIIIPEPELRAGEWTQFRDKGTVWLPAVQRQGIEVAIFLIRSNDDQSNALIMAGWHTTIVNTLLPDSRRLLVVASNSLAHDTIKRQTELSDIRRTTRAIISESSTPFLNPRLVLHTADENGTRHFVENAI